MATTTAKQKTKKSTFDYGWCWLLNFEINFYIGVFVSNVCVGGGVRGGVDVGAVVAADDDHHDDDVSMIVSAYTGDGGGNGLASAV